MQAGGDVVDMIGIEVQAALQDSSSSMRNNRQALVKNNQNNLRLIILGQTMQRVCESRTSCGRIRGGSKLSISPKSWQVAPPLPDLARNGGSVFTFRIHPANI